MSKNVRKFSGNTVVKDSKIECEMLIIRINLVLKIHGTYRFTFEWNSIKSISCSKLLLRSASDWVLRLMRRRLLLVHSIIDIPYKWEPNAYDIIQARIMAAYEMMAYWIAMAIQNPNGLLQSIHLNSCEKNNQFFFSKFKFSYETSNCVFSIDENWNLRRKTLWLESNHE